MKTKELHISHKLSTIDFYSKVLLWIWIAGIAISIITFLYLLIFQTSEYNFNPTVKGFSGFLTIFEFPIKLLTASVVCFGLWLTIKRMEQTNEQIRSITSNNRFNNFYKHREEFQKKFKEFSFIGKIQSYHEKHIKNRAIPPDKKIKFELSINEWASRFYEEFYYTKSKIFQDTINSEVNAKVSLLISELKSLPKSQGISIQYEKVSRDALYKILGNIPGVVSAITTSLVNIDKLELENSEFGDIDKGLFTKLNIIYWAVIILQDILIYDGSYSKEINDFIIDYSAFRVEKGS
ncbi:MAG: hypothetical protein K9J12_06200 [Melioribacteraceae bacterium]|nr:hypothetical protein [Melioribacteraceae bacterium]